jgi:hypothetical protein
MFIFQQCCIKKRQYNHTKSNTKTVYGEYKQNFYRSRLYNAVSYCTLVRWKDHILCE